jgi:hypothetical protein
MRLPPRSDLVEAKRDLSNERLSSSSSNHHLQLSSDKESRLLRELAACQLLEAQLRAEVHEAEAAARREADERTQWTEELRTMHDTIQTRDEQLHQARETAQNENSRLQQQLADVKKQLHLSEEEVKAKVASLRERDIIMKQIVGITLLQQAYGC